MLKIVTIIGARPQIIKAAALSRAIKNNFHDKINEVIVHTGQHYDENMSEVFFKELGIPAPQYNLSVGSGSHGNQTAEMIKGIEGILLNEKPNALVVYGDTNSTLAGAIAASKLLVPVVHIEAGLRSFNKNMPEEINRIMCDHVSTLLFSPTSTGLKNLIHEGFKENTVPPHTSDNPKIYHCGDVMFDNSLYFSELAENKSGLLEKLNITKNQFILATIHRNTNTDNPEKLNSLFNSFNDISQKYSIDIVLPLHPRTANLLQKNLREELYSSVSNNKHLKIIQPVSFLEMIVLEKNCKLVMTDSGGVQKEAFYFNKPCVILRPETEWIELVECGTAKICDTDEKKIGEAVDYFLKAKDLKYPSIYGDGKASEFICQEILKHIH
ncbi:MAG: non-hydrolyzing UDP-N-acetylglucosamine 2-epimerase [Bacteroidia bacterium]